MGKYIIDEERMKAVEENYKRVLNQVRECAVKAGRKETEVRLPRTQITIFISKEIKIES